MKLHTLSRPILATAIAAACGGVQAQAFDAVRLYGPPTGSGEGTVGAALIGAHQYLGSNERRTLLLPVFDYRWPNGWFAGTTNGVGYQFASAPNLQYGLRLTADFGRSESRSVALAGLGDIVARPEIGGFFNLYLSRETFLTSSLRYGSGNDRKGVLLDLGAGYALPLAPRWRAAAGLAVTIANRNYMQGYYGVTPAQAQTSHYAVYTAGAGVRDVRANLSLNCFVTPQWTVTGAVSLGALRGDANGSPIVRERSSVSGVAALSYRF